MSTSEMPVPKALQEVWEWKEAVSQDTKGMSVEEKLAYFREGMEEAARLLNCRIEKNPDGSFSFVPVG